MAEQYTTNPSDTINPIHGSPSGYTFNGLTKREYFAAMAFQSMLQGLIVARGFQITDSDVQFVAAKSVLAAGELIDTLNHQESTNG